MTFPKPGTIIKGPYWPEPVEIKFAEKAANYVHIIGSTTVSGTHVDQLVLDSEISISKEEYFFKEEPWKVFLCPLPLGVQSC